MRTHPEQYAGMLALLKKVADARDYPRNCPHRSARIGWQPDPDNSAQALKVWRCAKYDEDVTWLDCRRHSKKEDCASVSQE